MINLVWLIPLFPLIGFLINGLGRNFWSKTLVSWIGSVAILASFALSLGIGCKIVHRSIIRLDSGRRFTHSILFFSRSFE